MSPIMSTHILSNHRLTHHHTSFRASGKYYGRGFTALLLHFVAHILYPINPRIKSQSLSQLYSMKSFMNKTERE